MRVMLGQQPASSDSRTLNGSSCSPQHTSPLILLTSAEAALTALVTPCEHPNSPSVPSLGQGDNFHFQALEEPRPPQECGPRWTLASEAPVEDSVRDPRNDPPLPFAF